jgi:hypothetical protein
MEIVKDLNKYETELLLKVPRDKNKPPVIAVVFNRVKAACSVNADIVDNHSNKTFYINFKKKGNYCVDFELKSDDLQAHREYRDVKFDPVKLDNFLYVTRSKTSFLFVHLLQDFDQYFTINTPNLKKFELNVNRLILIEGVGKEMQKI